MPASPLPSRIVARVRGRPLNHEITASCQRLQRSRKRASGLGLCRAIASTHIAGVALMATSNERPTASKKAIDNGRKKAPCSPDIVRIGRNATATAAVA